VIINTVSRYGTGFVPAFGYSQWTFTAASQYIVNVFTAEEDMTITQLGMCVSSSSGTPPVRIAMWQYVKGQSLPANPLTTKTYTDPNPVSITPGISTPTFIWWNLTTPQNITRGNTVAIGLETYGTWSGGLSLVSTQDQNKRDYTLMSGQPFARTWTQDIGPFRFGVASATKTYGYPVQNQSIVNIGSFSTNTLAGVAFTVPTSMGGTCTLQGILAPISANPNFVTASLRLYNATSYPPTLITSRVIGDGAAPSFVNATYTTNGHTYFPFTTPQLLTTGVKYVVGIQNSGDAFNIPKLTFNRAQDANCLSDIPTFGVEADITANTWTESGTFRYVMNLDIDGFSPATGPNPPSTLTASPRYTINAGIN
jgi:hypothetical protein